MIIRVLKCGNVIEKPPEAKQNNQIKVTRKEYVHKNKQKKTSEINSGAQQQQNKRTPPMHTCLQKCPRTLAYKRTETSTKEPLKRKSGGKM